MPIKKITGTVHDEKSYKQTNNPFKYKNFANTISTEKQLDEYNSWRQGAKLQLELADNTTENWMFATII